MRVMIAVLLGLAWPTSVNAEWYRATTNHFIVYANDDPARVTAQARELELFDATLKIAFGLKVESVADPNPVTLYLVRDIDAVQKLYGDSGGGVAGFYRTTASGAVAFMPKGGTGATDFTPRLVLQHEYAHHFLLGNFAQAFPAWFSEGFAEFVSTFELTPDGAALGRPAAHRANMLADVQGEPISDLFKPGPWNVAQVYGQGWLLTHYFMTDPQRRLLLDKYFRNIGSGMRDPQAAVDAFGDLGKLGVTINTYMHSRRFSGFRVPAAKLPQVEIKLVPVPPGQAAMLPTRMISERGVDDQQAKLIYARAAPVAAQYPNDSTVQSWFAEIACDAKQFDAADAAADRALALDPRNLQALIYKGRTAMGRAKDAGEKAPAYYDQARRWIVRANKVSSDNAEPLSLIYESYIEQKIPPTDNAVAALYRAADIIPQDNELRVAAMRQHFLDGETAEGRKLLATLTFNVHSGKATPVDNLSAALDAGKSPALAIATFDKEIAERRAKNEAKRKSKSD